LEPIERSALFRLDGDRSRRRAYFKRVFIQTAPLSKDGSHTAFAHLRKAKPRRITTT